MRRIIVATLALSPMLLHAQANSPAKTQTSAANLRAELVAAPFAGAESDRGSSTTAAPVRISTGVNVPKLIYTVAVESDADFAPTTQFERTAVVAMTVDPSGKPTDLKIVQSVNPVMDRNVLAAVSQYRFTPGTLDDQPTAVPVNLAVVLRGAR
ncbi:TonB family protein [Tunturiibacter gelidoferens]|uniref:TonB family protein n=3 Tax=Tunturiibacter TaxID=3154218 RepID=A0A7Y9NQE0_9BACT|nr:TonB family protein [Edaphobacter lichenicola]MBB5337695.1 TonB family protein [Edaphobacter lichenicola]NYF53018.1 TonB family protein [Edaphobacter lichenicola]